MSGLRIEYAKVAPGAVKGMYAANAYFDSCGIPQALRRLLELRVSQINGCGYCVWLHAKQLRELGETHDRIAKLTSWRTATCFGEDERAAFTWAELATRISEGAPSDTAFAALRQHFDDRQIVDITAIIANMNALNRMAVSFRLEAPAQETQ
jgi:AhpD family alkylhydroperoxidase